MTSTVNIILERPDVSVWSHPTYSDQKKEAYKLILRSLNSNFNTYPKSFSVVDNIIDLINENPGDEKVIMAAWGEI